MRDEVAQRAGPAAALAGFERGVVLSEGYAGLQAQALGLAERAGIEAAARVIVPRRPWSWLPARAWPLPLSAVDGLAGLPDGLVLSAGGTAGAVGAALRRQGRRVVQIQNPRMRLDWFDLVVANRHDEIDGPNVLLTRTALHRVTPAVLAQARRVWMPRLAGLRQPLVAVLVGGSNGRFRLGPAEAAGLAEGLARLAAGGAGLAVTPSRRTDVAVRRILERRLEPLGAQVWDMRGENPYFGLLACADAIVVTSDSISMVSEAVATAVPVMLAQLPGRSRRIGLFLRDLLDAGRIRIFDDRLEDWAVTPLDDTGLVAHEVRRRLGLPERTVA